MSEERRDPILELFQRRYGGAERVEDAGAATTSVSEEASTEQASTEQVSTEEAPGSLDAGAQPLAAEDPTAEFEQQLRDIALGRS